MARCIIVGAGDFDPGLMPRKSSDDLLIAADAGYEHLKHAGIAPDICVGDFDSLGSAPDGAEVITLPVVKDDTDTVYAAKLGLERGYRDFLLLGVLGGRRFSHSLAALQTLMFLSEHGARGEIADRNCRILLLREDSVSFPAGMSGDISVFAVTDTALVTEEGLFYTLDRAELTNAFPLGVSNHFMGSPARITVHSGACAVVIE